MALKQTHKTPQVPTNSATAASGISLFPAAEDHDHGLSGSDFDHGELLGLADDDHAQYALLAGRLGTNDFTGDIGLTGNLKLPTTSLTVGQIKVNGTRFIHSFGTNNVFVGESAGNLTLSGESNVGVGQLALNSLTTGSRNFGLGTQALRAITTGSNNIAIGVAALASLIGDDSNIAIGDNALAVANGILQCVAIGANALTSLTTGDLNTAIGYNALLSLTTGEFNTAVGRIALQATTGSRNTGIGLNAGLTNTTGSDNVFIGQQADAASGALTNAIAIGSGAIVASSNYMMLGTSAICVAIGGAAKPTTGTGGLIFPDGTVLATMAANTAGLYADDVGGTVKMFAIDEADDKADLLYADKWSHAMLLGCM
jgi:hypothetical protein